MNGLVLDLCMPNADDPGALQAEACLLVPGGVINHLARDVVVPPGRISAIVNGKRAITADTALRLGKYFGVSPQTWMGLHAEYDLRVARRVIDGEVDRRVQRHAT